MTPLLPPDTIQSIPEALAFWANQTPDAVALLAPYREPATYRDLHEAVDSLANELRARGLYRQDGIALLLPEGPELCVLLLATIAAGIVVPLAWPNPATAYASILANPRVRAVVVSADDAAAQSECPEHGLPVLIASIGPSGKIGDLRLDGPAWSHVASVAQPDSEDIAVILHSSGTTGRPKLVPRTHRNLIATCQIHVDARGLSRAERGLSLSRTTYSQGLNILMTSIFSGASLIAVPEPNLVALPGWLNDGCPTYLSTTPAVLRAISGGADAVRDALRRASLRYILSSAGLLSTDDVERLEAAFHVPILNWYGMSEASFIATEPFPELKRVSGAVGMGRCEIRTVDEHGTALRQGQTGEIVVRGPRVFPGYLDDPEANAAAFLPGGWFRTGDLGHVDEDGFVYLHGRLNELINRGGEKIAPAEVDHALLSHPAVADAAVFAVPDALLGEDVVAAVVFKSGVRVERKLLHGWLLDRLALFKVPRRIWLIDELPRTRTGKVLRGELTRLWLQDYG